MQDVVAELRVGLKDLAAEDRVGLDSAGAVGSAAGGGRAAGSDRDRNDPGSR